MLGKSKIENLDVGRAEVEQRYAQALSNDLHAVSHSHPTDTVRVRFLRPDVAFVDVESVSGDTGPRRACNTHTAFCHIHESGGSVGCSRSALGRALEVSDYGTLKSSNSGTSAY